MKIWEKENLKGQGTREEICFKNVEKALKMHLFGVRNPKIFRLLSAPHLPSGKRREIALKKRKWEICTIYTPVHREKKTKNIKSIFTYTGLKQVKDSL